MNGKGIYDKYLIIKYNYVARAYVPMTMYRICNHRTQLGPLVLCNNSYPLYEIK